MGLRTIVAATIAAIALNAWHASAHAQTNPGNAVTSRQSIWSLAMNDHESIRATAQPQAESHAHTRAQAKITVHSSEASPFDQTVSPVLIELHLSETFTGDIAGESTVRALQLQRTDKSASMVSMQRFSGTLGGRQGTFVLQGSEIVENGMIHAKWSVVPGSGTGALSGLRGEGGFEGRFGQKSDGTLDYWFE